MMMFVLYKCNKNVLVHHKLQKFYLMQLVSLPFQIKLNLYISDYKCNISSLQQVKKIWVVGT